MSNELRLVLYIFAFVLFVIEAIWHRSLTAAGLAVITLIPLWDVAEVV